MLKLSRILRWISLAFLFGGSASIVFIAVSLVNGAEAHGIPRSVAAAANAPIFFEFSKIALTSAFVLLIAESLDYATHRKPSNLEKIRYTSSLLCAAAMMVFTFGLIPPMEKLSLMAIVNHQAREQFHKYHHTARIVFGVATLLALISLTVPAFDKAETTHGKQ